MFAEELSFEIVEEGSLSKSPVEAKGTLSGFTVTVRYKEAFMSKVFGGTTAITITYPSPPPIDFRITKLSLVARTNEELAVNLVDLGETFVLGRVRLQSTNPEVATPLFSDHDLLSELRGLMEICEDNVEITNENLYLELTSQNIPVADLLMVVKDSCSLATRLSARAHTLV